MSWNITEPNSATRVVDADNSYRDHWDHIATTTEKEHIGMGLTNQGYELPGECGIVAIEAYATINGLDDVDGGLAFATDTWDFYINDGAIWQRVRQIEQGTVAFFYQAAAPTGWTIVTTLNDRTLLVDNASGGNTGGSWTVTSVGDDSLDDHTHTYTTVISHSHTITPYASAGTVYEYRNVGGDQSMAIWGSVIGYTHYAGVASPVTTSTSSDDVVADGAWRPQAIACVACSKD